MDKAGSTFGGDVVSTGKDGGSLGVEVVAVGGAKNLGDSKGGDGCDEFVFG